MNRAIICDFALVCWIGVYLCNHTAHIHAHISRIIIRVGHTQRNKTSYVYITRISCRIDSKSNCRIISVWKEQRHHIQSKQHEQKERHSYNSFYVLYFLLLGRLIEFDWDNTDYENEVLIPWYHFFFSSDCVAFISVSCIRVHPYNFFIGQFICLIGFVKIERSIYEILLGREEAIVFRRYRRASEEPSICNQTESLIQSDTMSDVKAMEYPTLKVILSNGP